MQRMASDAAGANGGGPHKNGLLYLLLFCAVTYTHADEFGLVGEIDLNNDGLLDRIESGPRALFGQGGGPFVVTITGNGVVPDKSYVVSGNGRFAVERGGAGRPVRLWAYWRMSCCDGVLASYVFSHDGMEQQSITISPGDGGTAVGRAIYRSIFNADTLLNLKRISPYTPPPDPAGGKWGAG